MIRVWIVLIDIMDQLSCQLIRAWLTWLTYVYSMLYQYSTDPFLFLFSFRSHLWSDLEQVKHTSEKVCWRGQIEWRKIRGTLLSVKIILCVRTCSVSFGIITSVFYQVLDRDHCMILYVENMKYNFLFLFYFTISFS